MLRVSFFFFLFLLFSVFLLKKKNGKENSTRKLEKLQLRLWLQSCNTTNYDDKKSWKRKFNEKEERDKIE
jgi:hypothetical protein